MGKVVSTIAKFAASAALIATGNVAAGLFVLGSAIKGVLPGTFGAILAGISSGLIGLAGFFSTPGAQKIDVAGDQGTILRLTKDPTATRPVLYGQSAAGGNMVYQEATNTDNSDLYVVTVLAGHEIDSFVSFEWAGVPITFTANNADGALNNFMFLYEHLGTDAQTVDATLDAASAKWTSNHRLRGIAYAVLKLVWDAEKFPQGFQAVKFTLKGRKIYDPRLDSTNGGSGSHRLTDQSTWAWSENAVLCLVDYLRGVRVANSSTTSYDGQLIAGMGIADTRINWTNVIAEADVCDESVSIKAGGTENRYTCNGWTNTERHHKANVEAILSSMAGVLVFQSGKWNIYAGQARTATKSRTTDEIVGSVALQTKKSTRDKINSVRGVFPDAAKGYEAADYPPRQNATYVTEDGGEELWLDLNLPMTTSGSTAQRLAKIALERARLEISAQLTFNLTALQDQCMDAITFTHAPLNLSSQKFLIADWALKAVADGENIGLVIQETLIEEADSVYDWTAASDEVTIPAQGTQVRVDTIEPAAVTNLKRSPPPGMNIGGFGDVKFTANQIDTGAANDGEIRVQGSAYYHPDNTKRTIGSPRHMSTNLEGAGLRGTFYLCFTDEDPNTRFPGYEDNSTVPPATDQFMLCSYDWEKDQWAAVDNTGASFNFILLDTDALVGVVFRNATDTGITSVSSLLGSNANLPDDGADITEDALPTVGDTADNLVRNASFQSGPQSVDMHLVPWWKTDGVDPGFAWTEIVATSGLTDAANAPAEFAGKASVLANDNTFARVNNGTKFPVLPGETYRLQCYVNDNGSAANADYNLILEWRDKDDAVAQVDVVSQSSVAVWTLLTTDAIAPAAAVSVRLSFSTDNPGPTPVGDWYATAFKAIRVIDFAGEVTGPEKPDDGADVTSDNPQALDWATNFPAGSEVDTLFVQGTGLNNDGKHIVRVSGVDIYNTTAGQFALTVLKRSDHSALTTWRDDGTGTGATSGADGTHVYTVHSSEGDRLKMRDALVELRTNGNATLSAGEFGEDIIIIVTSRDSWLTNTTNGDLLVAEMKLHGASHVIFQNATFRIPYVLIGIPNMGEGKGIEIITDAVATTPMARYEGLMVDGNLAQFGTLNPAEAGADVTVNSLDETTLGDDGDGNAEVKDDGITTPKVLDNAINESVDEANSSIIGFAASPTFTDIETATIIVPTGETWRVHAFCTFMFGRAGTIDHTVTSYTYRLRRDTTDLLTRIQVFWADNMINENIPIHYSEDLTAGTYVYKLQATKNSGVASPRSEAATMILLGVKK